MPKVGRVGDVAGGKVISGANSVRVDGLPVAVLGSPVQGHGRDEHSGTPKMVEGSFVVRIEGKPVCRMGDHASCGHPLITASSVEVG